MIRAFALVQPANFLSDRQTPAPHGAWHPYETKAASEMQEIANILEAQKAQALEIQATLSTASLDLETLTSSESATLSLERNMTLSIEQIETYFLDD